MPCLGPKQKIFGGAIIGAQGPVVTWVLMVLGCSQGAALTLTKVLMFKSSTVSAKHRAMWNGHGCVLGMLTVQLDGEASAGYTGMSSGELMTSTWRDVDFATGRNWTPVIVEYLWICIIREVRAPSPGTSDSNMCYLV